MAPKVEKTEEEWRAQLGEEEFEVCRRKGTERAFTGEYHDCRDTGMYRCTCCGGELFRSDDKFDSGTGWPSFTRPVDDARVATNEDTSHGMRRVEVVCAQCDAHLGHVFPDGPGPEGMRYCINSVSLKLDKDDATNE